ncbi:hypothetical protein EXIGLDRAFT_614197 [Exidia glandulosa HHB12029]|uniref:Uncharacterized protein n=1 Tax=Exidia glandulosa HHB12029 TaxID=1314781 RepID=A0A166AJR8_EXIGL|nr:hypothetical protein EXIGLDRAFT_614197 [Exidia glandulosa HHB12029]
MFVARTFSSKPALSRLSARRAASSLVVGIRREDPQRLWERRCPLTPDAVHDLVRDGVRILVQDCHRRIFPVREFVEAGAEVHNTLQPAHIILGIKETPLDELDSLCAPVAGTPRTHIMFSHTTKGQPYNMPLLSRFVGSRDAPTLIDYELLTNEDGTRTVGFGWFAGAAGVVEGLCASAHAHLELGIASPFLNLARPYTYRSLDDMRAALRAVGTMPMPEVLSPFVIAVTGSGNVARGALDLLQELPVHRIPASELPRIVQDPNSAGKIYLVHVRPEEYLFHLDGKPYDRESYYSTPLDYQSRFHELIAPYVSLFVNGTGWRPGFPRLMTTSELGVALQAARAVGPTRLRSIADISCDVEGGLEFMRKATTIDDPYYTAAPEVGGVQVMSIDILPTELPRDASAHFSNALKPYLRALINGEDTPDGALARATVARGGELAGSHEWLMERLPLPKETPAHLLGRGGAGAGAGMFKKKKILLLGSGMVAKPAVDEFLRRGDVSLIVASNNTAEAHDVVRGRANAEVVALDMGDKGKLDSLVEKADVVVSLLPVPFHTTVAEHCIKHAKHLVTASYISPAMRALHSRAAEADVLLLNEIGLDPGIDHCSAIDLRARLEKRGMRITRFASFCGGLPAPECAGDVPLGYKFSWNPRGVLAASTNAARFKLDGTVYTVAGEDLMRRGSYFHDVPLPGAGAPLALEGVANRDSLSYASTYGLGPVQGLATLIRGTLRYRGFSDLLHAFKILGFLNAEEQDRFALPDWRYFVMRCVGGKVGRELYDDASVRAAIADVVASDSGDVDAHDVLQALEWCVFGVLAGNANANPDGLPRVPHGSAPAIDHFAALLAAKLKYFPHERDLVVLAHEIVAVGENDGREETWSSSLVVYGSPNESAMSRCVGLPVAMAALRVLDGEVRSRGVCGPGEEEVYVPVLRDLEHAGLGMVERTRPGRGPLGETLARRWQHKF